MDIFKKAEAFATYVGLELKGAIVARGRTAKELAEITKHSPAAFNRWLNGKTPIPVTVLCEVCEVLEIDPQKIVGWAYDRVAIAYGEPGTVVVDEEEARLAAEQVPGALLEERRRRKEALEVIADDSSEAPDLSDLDVILAASDKDIDTEVAAWEEQP